MTKTPSILNMNKICPAVQGANEVNAHVYIQTNRQQFKSHFFLTQEGGDLGTSKSIKISS
jgi:hypothetical protein